MKDAAPEIARFKGHPQALQDLPGKLSSTRGARERAELAGRLLVVTGDLGRRQKALPTNGVDSSLKQLKAEDAESWLKTADLESVKKALADAAESGLEASLADSEGERAEFAQMALTALAARDGLESALTALERWEALGNTLGPDGKRARERLLSEIKALDAKRSSLIRQLLGANAARRAELSQLDDEQRERAWWYSARAECDDFVAYLRDPSTPGSHLQHCPDCQKDCATAKLAERPADRHVTADELWDLDMGTLADARRRWIERHAKGCSECAMALRALAEGEEGETATLAPVTPLTPREAAPELVEARGEFKVLLFRDPRRARLVVEPVKSFRIAAARIEAPWAGSPSGARAGSGGVEFDLGPGKALRGRSVGLAVSLVGGAEVELKIEL